MTKYSKQDESQGHLEISVLVLLKSSNARCQPGEEAAHTDSTILINKMTFNMNSSKPLAQK